jgi:hypothetical protein
MTEIYESPDKGETVYVRQSGESERTLHSQSPRSFDLHEQIKESALWGNIHRAAKTSVPLADALDKVKMIYALIKKDKKTY